MSTRLATAIGLEVHVHLKSEMKIFCDCRVTGIGTDTAPNAASCPVCQGHPGVLPAFNWRTAEVALACGLALHCRPARRSTFERKHYFYPDIPKNFQLTQNAVPIAEDGWVALRGNGGEHVKKVRVRKVHLEEDAARNVHLERHPVPVTLVDFNRCGTPLLEIVSEADLETASEAMSYLEQLQRLVRWHDLSRARMEAGEMRCDANISVRPKELPLEASVRWELKNLNSIRGVGRALAAAIEGQTGVLMASGYSRPAEVLFEQTLGWDEKGNKLVPQRTKETGDDYFHFVEPDLRDIVVSDEMIRDVRARMRPDFDEQQDRLLEGGLSWEFTKELTKYPAWYEYYQEACRAYAHPKKVANWMVRDLLRLVKQENAMDISVPPDAFAAFVRAAEEGQIILSFGDRRVGGEESDAKRPGVLETMWETGALDPLEVAASLGVRARDIEDSEIESVVLTLIDQRPDLAARVREGETPLVDFFVGQTMRSFHGRVRPKRVAEVVQRALGHVGSSQDE